MKILNVVGTNNKITEIGIFTEQEYLAHKDMRIKDALFDFPHEQLRDFIPALDIEEMEKIDLLGCELATKIYYELLCAGGQKNYFYSYLADEFRPLDDLVLFCEDNDLIELLMKDHIYFIRL